MCPRGGSKGGKHFADTPQNFAECDRHKCREQSNAENPNVAHRVPQIWTKSNPVGEKPTGSFLLPKWGKSESHRRKRKEDSHATL